MKKGKYYSLILALSAFLLSLTVGCSKTDSKSAPVVTPNSQTTEQNQTTEQAPNPQQNSNTQQTPSVQTPDKEVTTNIPQNPNTQVTPNNQQPNSKTIVPDTSTQIDYIELVRGGTLYDYPWITVGEAFDSFFGQSNWYEFYDDYNNHIIEIEGYGYEYDQYVLINVQFILYPNGEFESWALWVDGELRSDADLQSFIEAVFNP